MCEYFRTFALEMRKIDLHNALQELSERYEQICIVGDVSVRCNPACKPLEESGVPMLWLDINESVKRLETVERIWDFLFEHEITRRGLMIAVGGGVLTDLAGFAAATYKRGMDYITIPTTLLAMVDASTGGKTGCNYHGIKNGIGAFHTPVETIIDPQWLHSLPARELLSGFAEMLKTALLDGEPLWNDLLQYDLNTMPIDTLTPLIHRCITVKEHIVTDDPHETGVRKTLNLGHTFGHALEEATDSIPHGYAVLYGLIAELYLSVTILGCPREPLQQLTQLMLHIYGRPNCNCKDRQRLIALMHQDKKNERAAEINCTLIRNIGEPVINQVVTEAQAEEAWEYLFSL